MTLFLIPVLAVALTWLAWEAYPATHASSSRSAISLTTSVPDTTSKKLSRSAP